MVEFDNCSIASPSMLNASLFELEDWFISPEDFHNYAFACLQQACNITDAETLESSISCPASLDKTAGGCWPRTAADQVAFISCPGHINTFRPDQVAHRLCGSDGVWRNLSYHECIRADTIIFVKVLLCYLGGSLSITSCLLAFAILHAFRVLHCGRVTLHKHFFVSNVGYSVCWIIKFAAIDLALMAESGWCNVIRVVEVLTTYFTLTNIQWMASEGLFLYANVVLGFVSEQKLLQICLFIGWGLALVPTGVFVTRAAILTGENSADSCWALVMADTIVNHAVITPIALALLVNLYFLVHIVVTLWMKMRGVTQHSRETNQTRKAVRAVLILFPLLGTQQLILVTQPDPSSNFYYAYEIISMIFTSCQGTVVAVLFCFANGEVIAALKRKSRLVRLLFKPCTSDEALNTAPTRNSSSPSNYTSTVTTEHRQAACSYSRLSVKRPFSNTSNK